jgi:hypothetical protein
MNVTIPASVYQLWKGFSLEIKRDLSFNPGFVYRIKGANGAGKTTFIRKLLLPAVQKTPETQYILYIEQQIQSQFDAIKAYAAMQKPAVGIDTFSAMISYLLSLYENVRSSSYRPLMIVCDECQYDDLICQYLQKLEASSYCLIYISHTASAFDNLNQVTDLNLEAISPALSVLA